MRHSITARGQLSEAFPWLKWWDKHSNLSDLEYVWLPRQLSNPVFLKKHFLLYTSVFWGLPFPPLASSPHTQFHGTSKHFLWRKNPKLSELYFSSGHLILKVMCAVKNWLSNHGTKPLGIHSLSYFILFFPPFVRSFRAADPQAKRNSCTGKFSTEREASWGAC